LVAPTIGVVADVGLLTWRQLGIEHAFQSRGRCASLRNSTGSSADLIASHSSTQAYGLGLPVSTFGDNKATCGHRVKAGYTYYYVSSSFPSASTALSALV